MPLGFYSPLDIIYLEKGLASPSTKTSPEYTRFQPLPKATVRKTSYPEAPLWASLEAHPGALPTQHSLHQGARGRHLDTRG
jgi:hypothetical protein